ncbi:MAG: PD40 domain-containing protein [Chloroflexi bacterium]|nr:PD40 domain-containing protein [Chloroflexota bacterium]
MNRKLVGVVLGAMFAAGCLPRPATPTPTPTPTATPPPVVGPQIAYVGNDGAIWVEDLESGASQRLSAPGVVTFSASPPFWSPDGEWLAYVQGGNPWEPGNAVFVVEASGGEPRKVGEGYAPAWSPDGSRLYFMSNFVQSEQQMEQTLFAAEVGSWEPQALATQVWFSGLWPVEKVVVSPQGDRLAVYASGLEAEGALLLARADGSQVREIGDPKRDFVYTADNFDWAPDGKRLVYRDSGDPFVGGEEPSLKIIDPVTQETIVMMPDDGFWPRWSPDGERILTATFGVDSGFTVALRTPEGDSIGRYDERTFGDIWGARPSWSPDSSRFLFIARMDANGDGQFDLSDPESEVWVISRDLAEARTGARGIAPTAVWSPDGSQIAIAMGEQGARTLWVVNADGSGLRQVADGDQPAWRP